ncbi:MAG: discoidin domain-containing protein, partial [Planctomycetes bacterium]|nr:discoidin domain-containing protein [Planctomycetota bacterium]
MLSARSLIGRIGFSFGLALCLALAGVAQQGALAADYYVSTTGDNANPGTDPGFPKRDIQVLLDAYPTIGTGDTVHVAAGTYTENLSMGSTHSGLTLEGAGAGSTTVNGSASGSCLCLDGFTSGTITGFTFTNGSGEDGGGIFCENNSSPTIANNTITGNTAATEGGGIECYNNSSPTITNNTITGNTATDFGGGIECYNNSSPTITNNTISGNMAQFGGGIDCYVNSSPTITNNTITGNTATAVGGGIDCYDSSPTITNNTITGNTATPLGGGMHCEMSSPTALNNILWGNSARAGAEIALRTSSTLTVGYCDVQGGSAAADVDGTSTLTWGTGNIDTDPLFANADGGDYHLKSQAGRWNGASWVTDATTSPCIDAGDPASAYVNEPAPNGNRINMGAYGNTTQASKTPPAAVTGMTSILTDQLTASSASSSSNLYNTYVAANAIDGNTATFWSSQGTASAAAQFLTLDLGITYTVDEVRLLPRAGSYAPTGTPFAEQFPSDFTIDASTDGQTWTQAASETGYTAATGVWYQKTFGEQRARYVRLTVPQSSLCPPNGSYYTSVAEFEAYGDAALLSWTAPGNMGNIGTAASYDVRCSTSEITTQEIWGAATQLTGEP